MKRIALAWVVVLAVALAGCGGKKDEEGTGKPGGPTDRQGTGTATGTGPKVKVRPGVVLDMEGKKAVFTDRKTGAKFEVGPGAEIPADFPKDIYLYSPSRVVVAGVQSGVASCQLMTSDGVDQVLRTYTAKMKALGWSEKLTAAPAVLKVREYRKGDRTVLVVVHRAGDKTVIKIHQEKEQ